MPALFLLLNLALAASPRPIFTEIQANPAPGIPEWVEIEGQPGKNLSNWSLDDGSVHRKLAAGTTVPAGGVLVLCGNCPALRQAWSGASIP